MDESCYCIMAELPDGRQYNWSQVIVNANDRYWGTKRSSSCVGGFSTEEKAKEELVRSLDDMVWERFLEKAKSLVRNHGEITINRMRYFIERVRMDWVRDDLHVRNPEIL